MPSSIFESFTDENGYLDFGDGRHNIALDEAGYLWIPKSHGLTQVNLNVEKGDTTVMKVEVAELKLFNEKVDWHKNRLDTLDQQLEKIDFTGYEPWTGLPLNLNLPYDRNYLGFRFAAINTTNASSVMYEYKLEGLETQWNPPSSTSEVSYAIIPPGTYAFKVRAIDETGAVSEEARFNFDISPPIWKTWYAYLAYFLLFVVTLYFFIRFRVSQRLKKITERQALRTKISADLHDDVGSILTGLSMQSQMMSLQASEKGKKELLELSEMSFEAMDRMRDTVWAIDPRRDSFENLVDRMRSFAEKNLPNKSIKHTFTIDIDKPQEFINPDKRQAVYLVFKEAITNVMKHSNASDVAIKVWKVKNQFSLHIKDNRDKLSTRSNSGGQGLANMKLRAEKIAAKLDI